MAAPRQMTAHTLEAPKGWPSPHAVDFRAKVSPNVTFDPLFAGRCVHLNFSGEYETGVPEDNEDGDTAGVGHMAIFTFQNSDDPDVRNDGGITGSVSDEPGGWLAVAPTGQLMGLVAKGAYELATTEFEPEDTLGSLYQPGHLLKATHNNASLATGGRLTKGIQYMEPIVGVVSRTPRAGDGTIQRNSHGKRELAFWPVWLPPITLEVVQAMTTVFQAEIQS